MTTPYEANLINEDRHKQEQFQIERLKDMGISVEIRRMSGDNSYPKEYALSGNNISAIGPTLDIALLSFLGTTFNRLAQAQIKTNPSVRIWSTSTDLPDTEMERKKYWLILEDEGKPDLNFIFVRGPQMAINVEPFVIHEYDYDERDEDEEDEDDYEEEFYGDVDEEDEEDEAPATAPLAFDKPEDFIL